MDFECFGVFSTGSKLPRFSDPIKSFVNVHHFCRRRRAEKRKVFARFDRGPPVFAEALRMFLFIFHDVCSIYRFGKSLPSPRARRRLICPGPCAPLHSGGGAIRSAKHRVNYLPD